MKETCDVPGKVYLQTLLRFAFGGISGSTSKAFFLPRTIHPQAIELSVHPIFCAISAAPTP
jgi:hypothetical protein